MEKPCAGSKCTPRKRREGGTRSPRGNITIPAYLTVSARLASLPFHGRHEVPEAILPLAVLHIDSLAVHRTESWMLPHNPVPLTHFRTSSALDPHSTSNSVARMVGSRRLRFHRSQHLPRTGSRCARRTASPSAVVALMFPQLLAATLVLPPKNSGSFLASG